MIRPAAAPLTEEPAPHRWIPVAHALPDLDVPCWLWDGARCWIGARSDDAEGWLWGNSYGSAWWSKGRWLADNDLDEDYRPLFWRPLPTPPERGL